jgi:hypothetical protein
MRDKILLDQYESPLRDDTTLFGSVLPVEERIKINTDMEDILLPTSTLFGMRPAIDYSDIQRKDEVVE